MRKINIQQRLTILDQMSLELYLQEIRKYDKLTMAKEIELFNEYKMTGNPRVKDTIVKANLRWVVSVAKQYMYPKAKLEDLINEGNIGLLIALESFDVSRGTRFITYATNYIQMSISSYCNEVLPDIPQPANRSRLNKMIKKSTTDLKLMGYDNPTDEQIVDHYMSVKNDEDLKMSTVLLNEVRNNSKPSVSMHVNVGDDDNSLELADTFKAGEMWATDYVINEQEKSDILLQQLNKILNDKESMIVCLHFGLNGNDAHTLDQIGTRLNYTRERIGQLLTKAITKLKDNKAIFGQILGASKDTAHSNESNHMYHAGKTF